MLKNKKSFKFSIKALVIIIIAFLLCGLITHFIFDSYVGNSKYLKIKLNGENEVILNYKDEYNDKGAKASYKNKDISKSIKVKNNLNLENLGEYTYTYTIKYKKQTKSISRIIKIVDTEAPVLELNGDKNISLYVGDKYEEKGCSVTDNYDHDLEVKVDGDVDTSKVGTYTVKYSVSDSSGNKSDIERYVSVTEKPKPIQKIAVLNYHFFYETDYEKEVLCGSQSICLKMDKFRQQLKWLNDNNYKTLTIKEFVSWMYGEITVPDKSVLLTIDDGALGTGKHNGNHLIPALEEYKIHATLFLITGWWDISNYQSSYLDVESHTHTLHESGGCNATCIGYDGLVNDLNKSINVTKSKEAFCFPFYSYSDEAIRAVRDVGFKVAFIGGNRKASRNDNKYKIPRYPIYDSTTLDQFISFVK